MKILIASDAFKDALSAQAVCEAIARGLKAGAPQLEPMVFPLGDGGEGTAELLTLHAQGQMQQLEVQDPLFRPVLASYGLSGDGRTAFVEMAAASGLQRLSDAERNPLKTTTYGTGQLLLDAIQQGAQRLVLCIGGSATNDAGMGMAAALGYRFLDEQGQALPPVGESLARVARIDDSGRAAALAGIEAVALCDVDNPLYGPKGAARVFAPQKGADAEAVAQLDAGLQHFAGRLSAWLGRDIAQQPGSGAAGGLGAGSIAFLGARLQPGIDTVMALTGFDEQLSGAQLVITGEGRLDEQTLHGKLIQGITRRAQQHGVPVIALCGALQASPEQVREIGLKAAFAIQNRPVGLPQALAETEARLEGFAFHLGALLARS